MNTMIKYFLISFLIFFLIFFSLLSAQTRPNHLTQPRVTDACTSFFKYFQSYDVILQPEKNEPEWWAGAPTVVRDEKGIFFLACRMRSPQYPRGLRGYEIRILRSTDGIHFQKIKTIKREEIPIPGFERPALLLDPKTKKFKLYVCGPWKSGHWGIIKLNDVDDLSKINPASAKPVILPIPKSYDRDIMIDEYKDPVIFHADGRYHCYVIGIIRRTERIYHFTSRDGEIWNPVGNPYESVMDLTGWHDFYVRPASVLPLDKGYLFIYEGSRVSWHDPVYNIATGLAFSFDLDHISDLNPDSPSILSSTPGKHFSTFRYSRWLNVNDEIWIYAEVACPNDAFELRLFRIPRRTLIEHVDKLLTNNTRNQTPEFLAPYFQPPVEFADDYGKYKSPLIFNDGSKVKTTADWQKRRREILRTWTQYLGDWPPLIEKPKIEYLEKSHRENFTRHKIRFEIAPKQQTVDGYLLIPDGNGPFPAVVVVYYDAETAVGLGKKYRDFAYQLAQRGFVALSIGTPEFCNLKAPYQPKLDSKSHRPPLQPLSALAYVAANCYNALATLPQVDSKRIGIAGHSYGGKWAMFAACLYDKFACAAVSDPGIVFDENRPNVNYWEPWYLGYETEKQRKRGIPSPTNPRTGAYKLIMEKARDLHELHALMAPRPFLVSGGAEDPPKRWLALNHLIAVNHILGYPNRVAMTNRKTHAPNHQSNEQIYLFLQHFLKPKKEHDIE